MPLNDYFEILGFSWFQIHFIENPGMAFGIEWGGVYGKLGLSLFRIVAISIIAYLLVKLIKQDAERIVIISISLIFAGALGNMLDSTFYGLIFSESTSFQVATFMPEEGGYTSFLHGKVVDMFYFPIIDTIFPSWVPIVGGRPLQFFEFIFNIADSSVFIGTAIIIIFRKHFFNNNEVITSQDELEPNLEDNIPLDIENTEGDELSEVVH